MPVEPLQSTSYPGEKLQHKMLTTERLHYPVEPAVEELPLHLTGWAGLPSQ